MVKLPITIIAPLDGLPDVSEDDIISKFLLAGYGRRRARFWIREFVDMGWMIDNQNGTYGITLPRTVFVKDKQKMAGLV